MKGNEKKRELTRLEELAELAKINIQNQLEDNVIYNGKISDIYYEYGLYESVIVVCKLDLGDTKEKEVKVIYSFGGNYDIYYMEQLFSLLGIHSAQIDFQSIETVACCMEPLIGSDVRVIQKTKLDGYKTYRIVGINSPQNGGVIND